MTMDSWQWIMLIWLLLVSLALFRRIRSLEESNRIHRGLIAAMFKTMLKAGMTISIEEIHDGSKETSTAG